MQKLVVRPCRILLFWFSYTKASGKFMLSVLKHKKCIIYKSVLNQKS